MTPRVSGTVAGQMKTPTIRDEMDALTAATDSKPPRLRRRTIRLDDGHRVGISVCGEGVPLVMIHGVIAEGMLYARTLRRLAGAGFRVIAIDSAGHGRTAGLGRRGWRWDNYVDLHDQVLDHLGIERAVFLGHSMGGRIVVDLAARRPERAIAVLPVNAAIGGLWDKLTASVAVVPPLFPLGVGLLVTDTAISALQGRRHVGSLARLAAPSLADRIRSAPSLPAALFATARAQGSLDTLRDLGDDGVPVIVLHGDRDLTIWYPNARQAGRRRRRHPRPHRGWPPLVAARGRRHPSGRHRLAARRRARRRPRGEDHVDQGLLRPRGHRADPRPAPVQALPAGAGPPLPHRQRLKPAMAATIESLPALDIAGHRASVPGGRDHPMRVMTRRAAGLEGPPWDLEARAEVGRIFDSLAPEWHTRTSPERTAVVTDALERGGVGTGTTSLEIGSGIGAYSSLLAERFDRPLAVDLSIEMLRLAAAEPGLRVRADACVLPLPDDSVDAVVLVNMLLFPAEVDRVLGPGGCVVWVNSSGESTPIHLLPDEVGAALPGAWRGVAGRAGVGLWAVFRRA